MASDQPYCHVHIGAPKTGSTFLQRVFFENRDALRARGLLYPEVSLRGFGHHDLAFLLAGGYPEWATAQERSLESLSDDLARAVAGFSASVLLSSENFYLLPDPPALKNLLETTGALAGRRARIIVYLRRQDDAHESWYNQRVKAQGDTGDIEESIARAHDLWDYPRQLALWGETFGEDNLAVRRYPPSDTGAAPLVEDMFGALEIGAAGLALPHQHVNTAHNRDVLAFQRQLNRLPLSPQEKRRFHHELMALSTRAKGLGLFDERPLLSPAERRTIMERYAAGNAEISKRYFAGAPLFADEPAAPEAPASAQPAGLTNEKLLLILGWILAQTR